MIWELQGTYNQQSIVQNALDRCRFPFDVLYPLLVSKVNRTHIPVEWADLSRWGSDAMAENHSDHSHNHEHNTDLGVAQWGHTDVVEDGEVKAHGIKYRHQVLGLAWYSGKVTLDLSMEANSTLAQEVFLSEAAHMVDFFFMTNAHRVGVWNAAHADDPAAQLPLTANPADGTVLGHGHGWFDVAGYRDWVGEAFMGLFVKAYSDLPVTIGFTHPPTDAAVKGTRKALTPCYGMRRRLAFHDDHRMVPQQVFFISREHAIRMGRHPCRICKP